MQNTQFIAMLTQRSLAKIHLQPLELPVEFLQHRYP